MQLEETHAPMEIDATSSDAHADAPNVAAGHDEFDADDSASSHGLVHRWSKAVSRARAAGSSDGVGEGSTGAAGHRVLAVPARSDVPAARGSVSEEPRPPTHTPEEEMAERLRAFEKATDEKIAPRRRALCAQRQWTNGISNPRATKKSGRSPLCLIIWQARWKIFGR